MGVSVSVCEYVCVCVIICAGDVRMCACVKIPRHIAAGGKNEVQQRGSNE